MMEHPFYGSWGYQVSGYYRADVALRHARRFSLSRRHAASARHRRDSRLGAGALSQGRLRAAPLRRHRAVRARRSAARRASRLGNADLQLRPQRSSEFPHRQRAVLARRVPRRRAARRRRRVDALPRLQPRRRASGCRTGTAGARISRRSTFLKQFNETVHASRRRAASPSPRNRRRGRA